jgi:hypothetical protein
MKERITKLAEGLCETFGARAELEFSERNFYFM